MACRLSMQIRCLEYINLFLICFVCVPFLFHREMRSLCCYGANWSSHGLTRQMHVTPEHQPSIEMRKDDERSGESGHKQCRRGGELERQQRSVQGLGNSYFLSPSLTLFSFSCQPFLAVKAQYLRHCNYWYGKDERSQLLAEEKEVTE